MATFSFLWLYQANSQVGVYRTIGPLVAFSGVIYLENDGVSTWNKIIANFCWHCISPTGVLQLFFYHCVVSIFFFWASETMSF